MTENPLTELPIAALRDRNSIKWRQYAPDVLPMWIAEMDVPLAEPIAEVLAAAVRSGDTGYAHPGRLREAFASYAQRTWNWTPDPGHMLVVPDAVRGITEVLAVVTEPGAGVVINTPAYPPFFAVIEAAGRRVVESPLVRGTDGRYRLDLAGLDGTLAGPNIGAYIVCNPHNPTGIVLTPEELAAVAELAERHRVRLIADEIHAPLAYPGSRHTPLATIPHPGAAAAVVVTSASKAWNLAGLKAALVVAASDIARPAISAIPVEATFGTGLFGVLAGVAAFDHGEAWLADLIAALDHNRMLLADLLAAMLPGVGYAPPQATFLAWLDLRSLGLGDDPAAALLERGRLALSNGPSFGAPGRGHARLNFATSPANLEEAVRRIAALR